MCCAGVVVVVSEQDVERVDNNELRRAQSRRTIRSQPARFKFISASILALSRKQSHAPPTLISNHHHLAFSVPPAYSCKINSESPFVIRYVKGSTRRDNIAKIISDARQWWFQRDDVTCEVDLRFSSHKLYFDRDFNLNNDNDNDDELNAPNDDDDGRVSVLCA